MGKDGVFACLNAGANDIGGTLMNESITRAAGSDHGQEWQPDSMEDALLEMRREPRMRTTLYKDAPLTQKELAFSAPDLQQVENSKANKLQRSKKLDKLVQVV
jgi:FO synthase